MRPVARSALYLLAVATVLGFIPTALAHGDEMDMDMGHGVEPPKLDPDAYPPTYFAHSEYTGVIYAHICLMAVAWVIILPTCEKTILLMSFPGQGTDSGLH